MKTKRIDRQASKLIDYVSSREEQGTIGLIIIPVLEQEDDTDDMLSSLGIEVSKRNSAIENDSQLCESFWAMSGVQGSFANMGDLAWA